MEIANDDDILESVKTLTPASEWSCCVPKARLAVPRHTQQGVLARPLTSIILFVRREENTRWLVPSEYPCPRDSVQPAAPARKPGPVFLASGDQGRRDYSMLWEILEKAAHLPFTVKVHATMHDVA
jgi:hypothetical protein